MNSQAFSGESHDIGPLLNDAIWNETGEVLGWEFKRLNGLRESLTIHYK